MTEFEDSQLTALDKQIVSDLTDSLHEANLPQSVIDVAVGAYKKEKTPSKDAFLAELQLAITENGELL